MFICTAEKLAHYVGVKFGWDMRVLVANQEKKKFTKPERPRDADGKLLEDVFSRDDYKMNMDIYNNVILFFKSHKILVILQLVSHSHRALTPDHRIDLGLLVSVDFRLLVVNVHVHLVVVTGKHIF